MRLLIRTVIVLAIVWIGLLLSGYGVLMGSTAQYIHSDSGIIGLTNCPVLRKSSDVIDNG